MQEKTLLRLVTCGNVDDGKSTLIGHLLAATGNVYHDTLAGVTQLSAERGFSGVDYSLLLDGLSDEQSQGITIDVAYRYFETPRRKYIVADCPGHLQYTRNLVTGASGAELAIILLDASRGIETQSKRHAFIASMLGIGHLVVAVNKMDLVGFSEEVFEGLREEFGEYCSRLGFGSLNFVPVSALKGDNLVENSENTPWYSGNSLLEVVENAHGFARTNFVDFRLPVQWVCRSDEKFRGYAGTLASGTVRVGDSVTVLPSLVSSEVARIYVAGEEKSEATVPEAVTVVLRDEVDVTRGDVLARKENLPQVSTQVSALLCWFDGEPLELKKKYILKHAYHKSFATVEEIRYVIDMETLHRQKDIGDFSLNSIGRVSLKSLEPLCFEPYRTNPDLGSFVLIDATSKRTVGGGVILKGETSQRSGRDRNLSHTPWSISQESIEARNGHPASVVWLTGLPASGKSTIARRFAEEMFHTGHQVTLLDGDKIRKGLCGDLGFSRLDRQENLRRVAEVARLLYESGQTVICAFVSPYASERQFARSLLPPGRFMEVFVRCSVETCRFRDPKGHYRKAESGLIAEFTGVSAPYHTPRHPELVLDTETNSLEVCTQLLWECLRERRLLIGPSGPPPEGPEAVSPLVLQ